jgi:hypothetical protein
LLAAHADFPTPDLDVLCLMEEPAELVETLAHSDVTVIDKTEIPEDMVSRLKETLPGKVNIAQNPNAGGFAIRIERKLPEDSSLFQSISADIDNLETKGFLLLENDGLRVCGVTEKARNATLELLMRFSQLAAVEAASS